MAAEVDIEIAGHCYWATVDCGTSDIVLSPRVACALGRNPDDFHTGTIHYTLDFLEFSVPLLVRRKDVAMHATQDQSLDLRIIHLNPTAQLQTQAYPGNVGWDLRCLESLHINPGQQPGRDHSLLARVDAEALKAAEVPADTSG
ncbi:hypothetical protein EV182_008127, partial [Spiromyces aspiralis]